MAAKRRFIYQVKYNQTDNGVDRVFTDAFTKDQAERQLKKQFPGVFSIKFETIEKEL